MKLKPLAHLLLATLPLTALAIEPGPSSVYQRQTEGWLQLQVNGQLATSTPQKASPAEREQALQRLIDSYKHPIPEYYDQKQGGAASSGSNN
jgi:hypothetical protein